MKTSIKILLLFCLMAYHSPASAQADPPSYNTLEKRKAARKELLKYDLSAVLTHTDNSQVFGFIGDNFQRLRIKFLSVRKDPVKPDTYIVTGKSWVKTHIRSFSGQVTLNVANISSPEFYGLDNEYKDKGVKGRYLLMGTYQLLESGNDKHSGVFNGIVTANVYIDKNNVVQYDDMDIHSDIYSNNQFTGQWISYDKKTVKTCNWGDYRILNSKDLDIGAGDFSPNEKYLQNGWDNLYAPWPPDNK